MEIVVQCFLLTNFKKDIFKKKICIFFSFKYFKYSLSPQITELNLDNCRSTNIVGLTDDFTALEALSLINVGLTTLKGFPKLPNLTRLELSDNRLPTTRSCIIFLNLLIFFLPTEFPAV